jgi:hypothetical protein
MGTDAQHILKQFDTRRRHFDGAKATLFHDLIHERAGLPAKTSASSLPEATNRKFASNVEGRELRKKPNERGDELNCEGSRRQLGKRAYRQGSEKGKSTTGRNWEHHDADAG